MELYQVNIVVCIKQVPDVDDIKWTKENNLDRSAMLSKINPADEWALDFAIKIKRQFKDVTLTAISMGPNQACEILEYALAKGATRAILLSDKAFAGSDTWATSLILSRAIKKFAPDFKSFLAFAVSLLPLAQNNPYAKKSILWVGIFWCKYLYL